MNTNVEIRDYVPDTDESFIYDSWLKSYLDGGGCLVGVARDRFMRQHRAVIAEVLQRSRVLIAHPSFDLGTICGWICCEPERFRMHYLYVKQVFRRIGVAHELLNAVGFAQGHTITVTACTRDIAELQARGLPYVFDPYATDPYTLEERR